MERRDSSLSEPSAGSFAGRQATGQPLVHVIDDDLSFRTSVGRLLQTRGFQTILYETAQEVLKAPLIEQRGCILLDVRMPNLDGLELQKRLSESGNILPIVFLTGYGDIPTSVRAVKAGAEDFLSKPVSADTLFEAVERALRRYDEVNAQQEEIKDLRGRLAALTPRELAVFRIIVRGNPNKQVAYELGASERTIKAHRQKIMQKLQVRFFAEVVSIAERLGYLTGAEKEKRD
jgi:FixJ family two-component response regulator